MTKGMRVGYIRVSTIDQKVDRQLENIELDKVFIDHASSKSLDRPQFNNMMSFVREGDTVIIHSLDRLARDLDNLRMIVKQLNAKGVKVQFLKENMIFTGDDSHMSNLLLSIMGAFAEFEFSVIKERQREGIAIARTKSSYKGRKKCLTPTQLEQIQAWKKDGYTIAVISRKLNVHRSSVYNYLKKAG